MQKYSIELVEEHDAVNFYSIMLEGKELTELESFFNNFPIGCEYDREMDTIVAWLDHIAESGSLERYFRPEGKYGDGVCAIPVDSGRIRLYCLRLSDKILIFGNGGVKDTRAWQESETLSDYVELLIDTSRFLASRIKDGKVLLVDKEILGDLDFFRDEKKQHNRKTSGADS